MSKRTPASNNTPSDAPKTRNRAARPAGDATTPDTPKAPRTRRKAQPPSALAVAADAAEVAVSETTIVAAIDAPRMPSHDEIAMRAYFIALERGFSSDPLADWLAAERELTLA